MLRPHSDLVINVFVNDWKEDKCTTSNNQQWQHSLQSVKLAITTTDMLLGFYNSVLAAERKKEEKMLSLMRPVENRITDLESHINMLKSEHEFLSDLEFLAEYDDSSYDDSNFEAV